jgi:glycosyltransferase involved in cell wall biosynthesis
MSKKILIHPDLFYSGHSGAIAAREACRQLSKLGYEIGVFTHDDQDESIASYSYYRRVPYSGTANYISSVYRRSFVAVIEDFQPEYVFFIGAIINTPLVYFDLCEEYKIKTVFLFLVQDFFCARLHAGLGDNSCTKCLDYSNIYSFIKNCAVKQSKPFRYLINYQINQKRFLSRMRKIDFVLGSSNEQLEFYRRVGVNKANIVKIPLFFDQNRVKATNVPLESYFVIIGQNRHEKGIHLIDKILDHVSDDVLVKLLMFDEEDADRFLFDFPENNKHIFNGKLQLISGVTMTTGALEIIGGSKGVINPSIWASTTEFVFLEVLGMSKPIITFDVGIHKEKIKNNINGICVKAGDFKQMGAEINNLNHDFLLYSRISLKAKELYHELTDENSFLEILGKIFK